MTRAPIVMLLASLALGCTYKNPPPEHTERLAVSVRLSSGDPLPGPEEPPLPLPTGLVDLNFDVVAQTAAVGSTDTSFNGFVRISAVPGSVVEVLGDRASGRNVFVQDGEALDQQVRIKNARGPTRIWAEDIGYDPADPDPNNEPQCANGIDDDGDGKVDFPEDPGCAFANDATENPGTYAAGVSEPVRFEKPRLADFQGLGATTPYELESVDVETDQPAAEVIVTRIAADGFYATDINETRGYGHVFAFTFSTPGGLRVCDRVTKLAGTASEFFGFTELSFPSFDRHAWRFPLFDSQGNLIDPRDGDCRIPQPTVITDAMAIDDPAMEKLESSLVRVENVMIGAFFGPEPPTAAAFSANASNCDLDGSGFIDFSTPNSNEAACANACGANANCVEWNGYISRGNYRVVVGANSLQINTKAIGGFDPVSMRGKKIRSLTGTLRNFSGGSLNWTIETRCEADLVCDDDSQDACVNGPKDPVTSQLACIKPRTANELEGQD